MLENEPPSATNPAAGPPADPRGPCLVVVAGPDRGEQFPLWGEQTTIGRASSEAIWEVRLTDRAVSRPHARIERRADGYFLLDLGSANGTSHNGKMITQPVRLLSGDEITIGGSRLAFYDIPAG